MRNFIKQMLTALVLCLVAEMSQAQTQQITLTGDIAGLHAVRVCLMTGNRGDEPREVAYAVADNGKFKMTFEEDPSLGRRYAFYIPTLDNDARENNRSREYFFIDAPKLHLVGKVDGSGIVAFDLPKSKMFRQFREAREKIDFGPYREQGLVEQQALDQAFQYVREWESRHVMGDVMSQEDSVGYKKLQGAWKAEADKYFSMEYGLGLQVLDQVSGKTHNRGLNAMVSDHFNGCTAEAMQPVIDKYLKEFGPGYMEKDYYLAQLWTSYVQRSMDKPHAVVYDFPLMNIRGEKVSFGDYKGKYIYANFWDLEDPDHQKQADAVQKLAARFKDSPRVVILNVSMNRDPALWRAMQTGAESTCEQWSVPEVVDLEFYKSYNVRELPRAVLIAPDFTVEALFAPVPADPQTEAKLEALAAGK